MGKVLVALLAAVLVLLAALAVHEGYAGEVAGRLAESGPEARLSDLHDLGQLQAAFNASAGTPRLILLLSPT
jgi:hypothetical protein